MSGDGVIGCAAMESTTTRSRRAGLALGALFLALAAGHLAAGASDRLDPPARTDPAAGGTDRTADLADLYAWHEGTGSGAVLVTALTFGGADLPAAGQAIPCDRDVLYTIHVESDAGTAFALELRLGPDELGNCFARITGLPGGAAIEGPVQTVLAQGGARAFVGLRDEPFFFDRQGLDESRATGVLSFLPDRDALAGRNTPAFVLELPLADVSPSGGPVRVWAESGRIGA